ncbi:Plant self-incompatibility S1 [Dillenia turbinata]|uniref:Plant self-incompatibility S1 n=1 Tax=Dillenia turbinata TaxID=194707 RepID=A0AAN8ZDG1_9MAGN
MTPFTKCALIILLTLTMCKLAQSYELYVMNMLAENMMANCWSKDRDIGLKNIPDGQAYNWDFALKNSEYWDCSIEWSQVSAQFPAFRPGDDRKVWCTAQDCIFYARRRGNMRRSSSGHVETDESERRKRCLTSLYYCLKFFYLVLQPFPIFLNSPKFLTRERKKENTKEKKNTPSIEESLL